jgi:hypothetical protein
MFGWSRVRFPALPDFLTSSGSGMGPLSLVRILRSYLNEKVAASVKKTELTTGEIRCADHVTPSIRKSWH